MSRRSAIFRRPDNIPLPHTGEWAALAGLACCALPLIALRIWRSVIIAPITRNEGFNAYHTLSLLARHSPYYRSDLTGNNYPPLYFLLQAPLVRLGADPVLSGRALSWVAFAGSVWLIFSIVRSWGRDGRAAGVAALFFAASFCLWFPLQVGTNEPQIWSHLFALAGIRLLAAGGDRPPRLAPAACFVLALFFKHNAVGLPASAVLALLLRAPRRGASLLLSCAVLGLVGALVCTAAFGTPWIANMMSPRSWDLAAGIAHVFRWGFPLVPAACIAIVLAIPVRAVPEAPFLALACGVCGALGVVALMSRGVYYNALFELDIALALTVGVGLAAWPSSGELPARVVRPAAIGALVLGLAANPDMTSVAALAHPAQLAARMRAEAETSARIVQALRQAEGDAICENLVYCVWAGKPFVVEPFLFGERARRNPALTAALLAPIAEGRIGAAQLEGQPAPQGASLYPGAVWAAAGDALTLRVQVDGQTMLLLRPPRRPQAAVARGVTDLSRQNTATVSTSADHRN